MADVDKHTVEVEMSAGSQNVIDQYLQLIKDASLEVIKEINVINSNLLANFSTIKQIAPSELDSNFFVVPNIFQSTSLDISSSNLVSDKSIPEYVVDEDTFMHGLKDELDSLNLMNKYSNKKKVATQWILKESCPDLKNSLDMSKFKYINKLCDIINEHDSTIGTLNGCIVNLFHGNSSRMNPHSDDERYVDQTSSICTFSLGAEREFRIFDKKHKNPKPLKTLAVTEKSVSFMQPGTQYTTKHMIMPSRNLYDSDIRYSISFRRIINTECTLKKSIDSLDVQVGPVKTSIIFGSSISKPLIAEKLAGKHRLDLKVLNESVSGALIKDVYTQMDTAYSKLSPDDVVKNIFICVGTNDITRNHRNGVTHLYAPIEGVLRKAMVLFPEADVYFQSLLPMPITNNRIVDDVLNFNKLVYKACKLNKCYFLDVFDKFLIDSDYLDYSLYQFRNNRVDVHPSSKGLGILARAYINIIRERFNPCIFY